ncbi:hypothetical protein HXX01_05605, partial [Candidatus Nomurabacteria bacterium]|nr:hypothetical protein [Candidatus Nomurabacteria bacterium]
MPGEDVVSIGTPLKKFSDLADRIIKEKEQADLSLKKTSDVDANVDNIESDAIHSHSDCDKKAYFDEKALNGLMAKLIFSSLLFFLIFMVLVYLFASDVTKFSSELPKQVGVLILGLLAII